MSRRHHLRIQAVHLEKLSPLGHSTHPSHQRDKIPFCLLPGPVYPNFCSNHSDRNGHPHFSAASAATLKTTCPISVLYVQADRIKAARFFAIRVLSLESGGCAMVCKKRRAIIGFVAVSLAVLLVWPVTAPMRGRMAARFDARQGHYKILAYGLPPIWTSEYAQLLKKKYGIEMRTVALCIVSETLRSYVDSYNSVSAAAANRKFGYDVFKECAEEVRKKF